jgi:hypothetical protein
VKREVTASSGRLAGLMLRLTLSVSAIGAEHTPRLIEFGAEPATPAVPIAVPDWTSRPPSGIGIVADELPQTPVPMVLNLPEIAPFPEVIAPPLESAARTDLRLPVSAIDDLPAALVLPALDVQPVARAIDGGMSARPSAAQTNSDSGAEASPTLPSGSTAAAPAVVKPARFVVRGNRSLSLQTIQAALSPFVAVPDSDHVQAACEALQIAYADAGRPFVRVKAVAGGDDVVLFEVAEPVLRSMQVTPSSAQTHTMIYQDDGEQPALNLRMTRGLRLIRSAH